MTPPNQIRLGGREVMFLVNLSNAVRTTIADSRGVELIKNDD